MQDKSPTATPPPAPDAQLGDSIRPGWPRRMVDILFALGLTGLMAIYVLPVVVEQPQTVRALVCVLMSLVCLALVPSRRERPARLFAALCLMSAILTVAVGTQLPPWLILLPPALFCVEAYEPSSTLRRWLIPVAGALWLATLVLTSDLSVMLVSAVLLFSLVGWARGVRVQRQYQQSLLERVAVAERERDLRAKQAVAEERARIARDIHDLVSHSLAVVAVQAAGGQRIAARDPGRAVDALAVIGQTARDALAEMRAMLAVLREGDVDLPGGEPSPGLPEIESLVAGLSAGGVPVGLEVSGTAYRLTPGVELAAHRVVQEALTNAVKHGRPGAGVQVRIDYQPDALIMEVHSHLPDDASTPSDIPGGGSGQVGMRERLALYGGNLQIDRGATEYCVRATIPHRGDVHGPEDEVR